MKECPQCGASYGDADVTCAVDGAALDAATPSSGPISPRASEVALAPPCPGCGAIVSDDGDGFCIICGHRVATKSVAPSIPPRTMVGRWAVVAARGLDDFSCRSKEAGEALLVIGHEGALASEAAALAALEAEPSLPRVVDRGVDARWGAFLTLSRVPGDARALVDAGRVLDPRAALELVAAGLDLADHVERAGYDWAPMRDDFYVSAGGALLVARLRGSKALGPRERLDARTVTEAIGAAFLPRPAVHGGARFVRFVSAHYILDGGRMGVVENERDELEALRAERAEHEASARDVAEGGRRPDVAFVVCDPGMKRGYNEDAGEVAVGETAGEPWSVLVVCDGVSSSTHAEKASAIAAKTACDRLAHFARSGGLPGDAASQAVSAALRSAHAAICAQRFDHGANEPPGTTIVAALVYRRRVTVGWVGDSRAYWIGAGAGGAEAASGPAFELLTRDHSWVNETVARGEMTEAEAMRQPLAHALTRCLGPLEVSEGIELTPPDVRSKELEGPGLLVLCSDGLWNYFPAARDIARLLTTPDGGRVTDAATAARLLVNHALERGGHDNVTVAVYVHE